MLPTTPRGCSINGRGVEVPEVLTPMEIDWASEIVHQLNDHWVGQLRPRLDGMTDDEYFWEPAAGCWGLRRAAR